MPVNADNLSTARRSAIMVEEPTGFMTDVKVEAMLMKEMRKPPPRLSLDLKLSYLAEVAAKPYPQEYKVLKLQKYNGRKGNTKENVIRFLDLVGPIVHEVHLCLTMLICISEHIPGTPI